MPRGFRHGLDQMLSIRPTDSADLPALVALANEVLALHAHRRPQDFSAVGAGDMRADLVTMMAIPGVRGALAEIAGEPVGFLIVRHVVKGANAFKRARNFLLVEQMGVAATHRRRGVGRALLGEARRIAQEVGATRLELEVWALNPGARTFHAALGFAGFRVLMESEVTGELLAKRSAGGTERGRAGEDLRAKALDLPGQA